MTQSDLDDAPSRYFEENTYPFDCPDCLAEQKPLKTGEPEGAITLECKACAADILLSWNKGGMFPTWMAQQPDADTDRLFYFPLEGRVERTALKRELFEAQP